MGNINITQCIFTGLPAKAIINSMDGTEYYVVVNNKSHLIRYGAFFNSKTDFILKNLHYFYGLLYNDDWFEDEDMIITQESLIDILRAKIPPSSQNDRMERLFLKLFSFQKEDGDVISGSFIKMDELWRILYFKSQNELNYYFGVLNSRLLIEASFAQGTQTLSHYKITYEGLNYAIKLSEEGNLSNKCFIAMSFKLNTSEIRSAIKNAVIQTGFVPIIVDELNIDSDKTINDEIIANLKKCNFCIADFTNHSSGVYFESGYALGQGKKVIYTCSKEEFASAHFDIKPLQHIIYESTEQLTKDLINKIEAWIK